MEGGQIEERLRAAIEKDKVSHAYIVEGPEPEQTRSLAESFVRALLCGNRGAGQGPLGACGSCVSCRKLEHGNHEDVVWLCKDGASVKDAAVEELQQRLRNKPYVGRRNIGVIRDADTMTRRAQNRLLKTLEEPEGDAVLILLSENTEHLLPTILSRCIQLRLDPDRAVGLEEAAARAGKVGSMLAGRAAFVDVAEEMEGVMETREQAHSFLDALERWFRDLLIAPYDRDGRLLISGGDGRDLMQQARYCKRERILGAVGAIEQARRDLNRNVNIRYVMKRLILEI